MFDSLRHELARRQIAATAVVLPGDSGPAQEGALRLRADDARGGWSLETVDYGRPFPLGAAHDADGASAMLLSYLDRPLPEPRAPEAHEIEAAVDAVTSHLSDLHDRASAEPLLATVPAEVPIDRIGALDGTMLFPYGTAYEARSLPPVGVLAPGSARHAFLTRADILVRVEVAAPWFGQRGGGLRLTLADDFVGVRDLVVAGALERIRVEA